MKNIQNHPLYSDYVAMKTREKVLLHEEEEIRKMIRDPKFRKNWTEKMQKEFEQSSRRMISAGKKLDQVEEIIRNDVKSGKKVSKSS